MFWAQHTTIKDKIVKLDMIWWDIIEFQVKGKLEKKKTIFIALNKRRQRQFKLQNE